MQSHWSRVATAFDQLPRLRERLLRVLLSLPEDVQMDFVADPTFEIVLESYRPGRGSQMFMRLPVSGSHVSRCVVLRGKLDNAPENFAMYVIAHELAHAFLRNGGWGDIDDVEEAADALAGSWGYPKPSLRWF